MRGTLFVDTSAIYAYVNRKDPDHEMVKKRLASFRGKLVITNYIFDEVITLVSARLGHGTALKVGNILLNSPQFKSIWVTPGDEREAWLLFSARRDKGYSFTDCVSFVIIRRLKLANCLALDIHFRQEGYCLNA
ncbi:MAG: PIN domain-containing protein [Nitrospirae bacterium]|nr:PIN domain-containing protein [Nitrospirota bacterium]